MAIFESLGTTIFDGTNTSVEEISHEAIYEISQGAIAFEFNPATTNGAQGLFSKDSSFFGGGGNHALIYLDGTTLKARFQDGANQVVLEFPGIAAGQSYEVAANFSDQGVELWVNGVLVGSDPLVMDWTSNIEYIQWGGRGWASAAGAAGFDAPFEGTISERQIYDSPLSSDDISRLTADLPLNYAPIATADIVSTTEDTSVLIAPLTNDSDEDGDTLSVSSYTTPGNGSLTDNGDGTWTYTPDADFTGADSFTYTVSDGDLTDSGAVSIIVDPVNDAPVAADDTVTMSEDNTVIIDLSALVSDIDSTNLTITPDVPGNGSLTDNGDGTWTYTPDADFTGADSFTYTVSDGDLTDSGAVSIIVDPVNDAPVAADDTVTMSEDNTVIIDLSALVSDIDSTNLTITPDVPGNGSLTDNGDGTWTYTPDADFTGADSFTYTVSDGDLTDSGAVSIIVDPVNDAPVAADDTVTMSEDNTVIIDLSALVSDIDSTNLTITPDVPGNGSLTDNGDGTWTYTPDADFTGADSFTYTVSDGDLTDSGAVSIIVDPVNDAPVAADDTVTMSEDNTVIIDLSALVSDIDSTNLTITPDVPGNGSLTDNGDGTWTYTPDADFTGADSFTYTVSDGDLTDSGAVSIIVDPVNDAPVAADDTVTMSEDNTVIIDLSALVSDIDSTNLTITPDVPGNGSLTDNGDGTWTYTPDADFTGADSFTYTVSDGDLTDSGAVSIIVDPVNDAPNAEDDNFTLIAGQTLFMSTAQLLLNDSDLDGDTLAINGNSAIPSGEGAITDTGPGGFTYDSENFVGETSFTYTITDGNGGFDTATVFLTVQGGLNTAPTADDFNLFLAEDGSAEIDVFDNVFDADGDDLSVTFGDPIMGEVVLVSGDYRYIPNPDDNGADSFTYTVSDGNGGSATATVSIIVDPVNDAPVAADDTVTMSEDNTVIIDLSALVSDIDSTNLTITPDVPGNGSLTDNGDGTWTYTPDADFTGADSFTYTVSDGDLTDSGAVSIIVDPVNDAPVAADDTVTMSEDNTVIIDLSALVSDIDSTNLTITPDVPGNGSLTDNGDGTWTYTPDADFTGADSFTYTVSDGDLTDSGAVSITVTEPNTFPTPVYDERSIVSFDGSNDAVLEIPHDPAFAISEGAIAFSFVPTDTNGAQGLFTKDANGFSGGGNHTLIYLDGPTLIGRFQDGSNQVLLTTSGISGGVSHEVVANFSAAGIELWVDGVLVASDPMVMDWTTNVEYIQWGGRGWSSATGAPGFDAPFDGTMSDLQIYGQPLTPEEIAGLATRSTGLTAPIAQDDAFVTDVDMTAVGNVLADNGNGADISPEGDTLMVDTVPVSDPSHGDLALQVNGDFVYTPDADYVGLDSFSYAVGDGFNQDTARVIIGVNSAGNDGPQASDDSVNVAENGTAVIDIFVNDSDPNGDALSLWDMYGAAHGTLIDNGDGTVTYTPDADYSGADSFSYVVEDGLGGFDTAEVNLFVEATQRVVLDATDFAPDGTSGPQGLSDGISLMGYDWYGNPAPLGYDTDFEDFGIGVFDGRFRQIDYSEELGGISESIEITFNGLVENVELTFGQMNPDERSRVETGIWTAYDENGIEVANGLLSPEYSTLGYFVKIPGSLKAFPNALMSPVPFASVVIEATGFDHGQSTPYTETNTNGFWDNLSYQPVPFEQNTDFNIMAISYDRVQYGFNVDPVAADDGFSTTLNAGVSGNVLIDNGNGVDSDADGDALSVNTTPVVDVANGTLVLNGDGSFTYTPDTGFIGTDSFTYELDDGFGGTDTAVATINVTDPSNIAPDAQDDAVTVAEDSGVTVVAVLADNGNGVDSDANGDPLTISGITQGANGSVTDNGDGTVSYTPDANFSGTDSFTYTITDGRNAFDTATVTVTVTPENDDPVAVNDIVTTGFETAIAGDVTSNDVDPDGDTLTVGLGDDVDNGTLVLNGDGTFTYTPDAGYEGPDSFTYTIDDGNGGTDTASVSITVESSAPTPIFTVGSGVTTFGGGTGDVINLVHDTDLEIPEGTIAFSFKDFNTGVRQGLFTKDANGFEGGGNHFVSYIDGGDLIVRFQNGVAQDQFIFENLNNGQEYEFAATFGASGVALWIDGVEVFSDPGFAMSWETNVEHLQVGGLGWSSASGSGTFSNPFSGEVADVEIYDEILDAAEINALATQSSFDL